MKTFEEIEKIVTWWLSLKKDYADIEMLLYMQQKLSGHSFFLASICADYKRDYNIAYFWRKINVNKQKNTYIKEGNSAASSDAKAIERTEEELRKETDAESQAFKADLLLKQVNKIIDALRTKISYLKEEQKNSRDQSQINQK